MILIYKHTFIASLVFIQIDTNCDNSACFVRWYQGHKWVQGHVWKPSVLTVLSKPIQIWCHGGHDMIPSNSLVYTCSIVLVILKCLQFLFDCFKGPSSRSYCPKCPTVYCMHCQYMVNPPRVFMHATTIIIFKLCIFYYWTHPNLSILLFIKN